MKHSIFRLLLITIVLVISELAGATNYFVGPSRSYTTLGEVRNLLNPGDTVFVDGDASYAGGIVFSRPGSASNRIVIQGIKINNQRPVIDGSTNGVAFINGADHYTFQGFEVKNATFRGIYHQAGDLILRDLLIHHCNNGIMGADEGSGSLLLEYSEIYSCGSGDRAHQIYMATNEIDHPGSVFRMQFCYLHDGTGGNNVKSRAERNEIYYNWIEGAYYHELELIGPDPSGGVPADHKREDSDVVGNVLIKRRLNSFVVRIGGDATGETYGRYRFVNNTIIQSNSATFRLFDGIESVEMHNNIIIRDGEESSSIMRLSDVTWKNNEQISGSNNYVETGLTGVPSQWNGTIRGSEDIFQDLANFNLHPAEGKPIIDAGNGSPQSSTGFEFPSPAFPPQYNPPQHAFMAPGNSTDRAINGIIDVGAFEFGEEEDDIVYDIPVIKKNSIFIFPNPVDDILWISDEQAPESLTISDIHGRVWTQTNKPSNKIDMSSFPDGLYIIQLKIDNTLIKNKVVKR